MKAEGQEAGTPTLKHEHADLNGIRLHYVTTGTGELILFVHGFPEFWYAWKNQLTEFGQDYHVVAPDMRGYNLSAKPSDVAQYRVGVLVEDVRALAEHLGDKKFTLVGHDWGGGRGRSPCHIPIISESSSSLMRRIRLCLSASSARTRVNRRQASTC